MTLVTLRMILVIKGYKKVAATISIAEVYIYLIGLTIVLDNLDEPSNIVAYCLGWGLGVYSGGLIENKLALGYIIFDVIIDETESEFVSIIRSKGFGVTAWKGQGKDGERICMKIIIKRKNERKLRSLISQHTSHPFIVSYELNKLNGGFVLTPGKNII